MINLQELRLGNIIRHNVKDDEGNYCEPNEAPITEDDMWHFVGGVGLGDAEPVELTEEWLKKLKFKKVDSDIPTFWLDRMLICQDVDGNWYCSLGVKVIVKYVHRLQNLYFEIKNIELLQ